MNKRHPKRCKVSGKVKYQREGRAWEAARQSTEEWPHELFVYGCRFCGKWHLTKKDRPDNATPRRERVGAKS